MLLRPPLSPFEVSADKDTGYAATNTLAGTRLNTPVKDLGASLSILTKDLINDLGASNVNDLLIYTAGMEAAGPTRSSDTPTGATASPNAKRCAPPASCATISTISKNPGVTGSAGTA